jgi:hypothetical protein
LIRSGRIAWPHFRGVLGLLMRRFIGMLGVNSYGHKGTAANIRPKRFVIRSPHDNVSLSGALKFQLGRKLWRALRPYRYQYFCGFCKLNKTNHMATGELLPPTSFIMAP